LPADVKVLGPSRLRSPDRVPLQRKGTITFKTKTPKRFALALLAAICLTPAGPIQAAPGDALGGEFLVNTTTADNQRNPAIAMAADGDFVVAWDSCPVDVDGLVVRELCDVLAQRFDANGALQGGEFLVNTTTGQAEFLPDVAMDAEGYFVVVWWGYGPGGSYGIFGQRFGAAGEPLGPEFQVNTSETPTAPPSVAMDADGDFVVAWAAAGAILAQRYNAAGEPRGAELVLDPSGYYPNEDPDVAMDAAGNFVVAWRYSEDLLLGQRYDASGVAQGDVFSFWTVNAHAVAMDADGGFVVVFENLNHKGESIGVFGQRYDAAGDPMGSGFKLGAGRPDVVMDGGGAFVVTWTGYGASAYWGVHGQRFSAEGVPQGGEFQVNRYPTTIQAGPSVAIDADGNFVVTWLRSDGDGNGVFARTFDGLEQIAADFDGDGKADLLLHQSAFGRVAIWLMDGATIAHSTWGRVSSTWAVAGTGDFNGDGKADILWRDTTTGRAIIWQMNGLKKEAGGPIGAPPLVWTVEQLRDINGDGRSDILWRNTATGGTVVWRMNGFTRVDDDGDFVVVWWGFGWGGGHGIFARRYNAAGVPQGPEFKVNTHSTAITAPSVAMDADGNFVVVWSIGDILARRYNALGEPLGGDFFVAPGGHYLKPRTPDVAMGPAGNSAVAWEQDGRIKARRYDAGGGAQGDPFFISSAEFFSNSPPAVAMDADGDFVVVWESFDSLGLGLGVFGQRYDAAGDPTGSRFQLGVGRPDVAMDGGGAFVVTWTGYGASVDWGVQGQRFSAEGVPEGGEFEVNSYTTTTYAKPSVAMDADGDFVVTWLNWDGDSSGISAQRFDGAKTAVSDFDGDGKADILWRNTVTGNTVVWLMDGAARLAEGSIGWVPTDWTIAGTGDFNGDGKADVLWRNSGTGMAVV